MWVRIPRSTNNVSCIWAHSVTASARDFDSRCDGSIPSGPAKNVSIA